MGSESRLESGVRGQGFGVRVGVRFRVKVWVMGQSPGHSQGVGGRGWIQGKRCRGQGLGVRVTAGGWS